VGRAGQQAGTPAAARDGRRSKDDYLDAGMAVLAEAGIGAVTIATVCRRLDVTKGSFYHHFPSGPAFHAALLERYEDEYGRRRIEAVARLETIEERLDALVERGVTRDHGAESALRAWSRSDPAAAEVVQRVDAARSRFLVEVLVGAGMPRREAAVHADVATALVAGAQAMQHPVDERRLRAMLQEHRRWIEHTLERGG